MIIDELLVALGYEFNDEELKEFNESLDTVVEGLETLAVAAGAAAVAFTGLIVASAQSTDQLAKQSREIGIAVDELDAYNFAAEQAIGSSDGVAESLRQLSIRSSEAARGTGSAVEAFGILGISVTDAEGRVKDVNTLLLESADALNSLENEAQRVELADKLGLAPLNLLLQEGSQGIAQLTAEARELGVITAEDAQAAEDFNDQWNRLVRVFTNAVRLVATQMLPVFTDLLEVLQEWFQTNQEIIQSAIISFLDALIVVLNNLRLVIIAILSLKFVIWVFRLTVALKALGAAAIIAQAEIFAIVIALAAIVAAIALVIEDFIVFQQGGDSAIGRLLERFPILKAVIEGIGEAITALREVFTELFVFINNAITVISNAFDVLQLKVSNFFSFIERGFRRLQSIGEFLGGAIFEGIESINGAIESAGNLFSGNNTINALGTPALAGVGGLVQPSALGNTISNSNRSTNINRVELNINGGNLQEVRRTVEQVIDGQLQVASNNAQSPVAN